MDQREKAQQMLERLRQRRQPPDEKRPEEGTEEDTSINQFLSFLKHQTIAPIINQLEQFVY